MYQHIFNRKVISCNTTHLQSCSLFKYNLNKTVGLKT